MNRAERRRQERDGDKRLAKGFDSRLPAGPQIVALMRALDRRLAVSIQRRSVSPLMEFVYANMSAGSRLLGEAKIACGRGCSHCCHSWVDASAAEVLFAVKSMSPGQRLRALAAVDGICETTGGKGFDARTAMVTPCPLLEDHACSAYAARLIVCRSAVSADAAACGRSYLELSGESIPVPSVWRALGQVYAVALEAAALHAGLVPGARVERVASHGARRSHRRRALAVGRGRVRGGTTGSAGGDFRSPRLGGRLSRSVREPAPSRRLSGGQAASCRGGPSLRR